MWELAEKFEADYYPTMERLGVDRPKAPTVAIRKNLVHNFKEGGMDLMKESIRRNYRKHLGEISGNREADRFLEGIRELLAEIVLSGVEK